MAERHEDSTPKRRWLRNPFRRRPVYGPPLPNIECGDRYWLSGIWCDLPFGHAGQHGHVIGRSSHEGPFVKRTSVTRQMWS